MSLQIVLFSAGERLIDKAIRKFSPGFEHAAILDTATGGLWEALVEEGVQCSPSIETHHGSPEVITLLDPHLTPAQEADVLAFLRGVEGAPYDLRGILAVPLWTDWDNPGHYFCSEVVAAALQSAAAFPLSAHPYNVWPCHLGWLAPAVWTELGTRNLSNLCGENQP